jgi:folate-binding protein YgfZ
MQSVDDAKEFRLSAGYQALRESAAWFDVSSRGRIRATGEDRKRLLHALTTNHVQGLEAGQGLYCFFLNAQGRVLADAIIAARAADLLISVEAGARESIYAHIDRYIIADDVTLEDLSETTCELAMEGPDAAGALARLGVPAPEADYGVIEWAGITILRASATGAPGLRLIAPAARKNELQLRLAGSAVEATDADLLAVRLEHGRPRYGVDYNDRNIAHETGLLNALNFQKGCYLGQEIVERVHSRALIHRQLVALRIAGDCVPAAGEKLLGGDKEVGEITSAAWSPAERAVRALGYLRLDARRAGDLHTGFGDPAELV